MALAEEYKISPGINEDEVLSSLIVYTVVDTQRKRA